MILEIYITLSLLMEAFICWVAWKLLRIEKAEARKAGFEEMREKIKGEKKTKILEWHPPVDATKEAAEKLQKELQKE
jgi:uncharacterized protein YjgD (DUF1641 family)